MTEEEIPWWYSRCTHRTYNLQPWEVIREAEGLAIIHLRHSRDVHILIDRPGLGSICKQMPLIQYGDLDERELLTLIQLQLAELRSSLGK